VTRMQSVTRAVSATAVRRDARQLARPRGQGSLFWRAEVRDGKLTELRNGLDRGELIAKLFELGEAKPNVLLDWTSPFRSPRGGARRMVGPAGRTSGRRWRMGARFA
jgi:hypothetical protein